MAGRSTRSQDGIMKDLEAPEHRAMERDILRAAREGKRSGSDGAHIAIGVLLLIAAIVLQLIGYSGVAVLLLLGFVLEMAAHVVFGANRRMPKAEVPPVSAALEPRDGTLERPHHGG